MIIKLISIQDFENRKKRKINNRDNFFLKKIFFCLIGLIRIQAGYRLYIHDGLHRLGRRGEQVCMDLLFSFSFRFVWTTLGDFEILFSLNKGSYRILIDHKIQQYTVTNILWFRSTVVGNILAFFTTLNTTNPYDIVSDFITLFLNCLLKCLTMV